MRRGPGRREKVKGGQLGEAWGKVVTGQGLDPSAASTLCDLGQVTSPRIVLCIFHRSRKGEDTR